LHLPVVDDLELKGMVSENDLLSVHDPAVTQVAHLIVGKSDYITENQHPYDAIATFSTGELSAIPLLDSTNHYIGTITLSSLTAYLAEMFSITQPGGIIILEIDEKDYLLTEIAQIVESNDAKILSLYVRSQVESRLLEVTLKLNKINIDPVLQTFERYGYTVKASFSENADQDYLKDRFNSFLKYLNV
ncbi:MAG: CBS domain-containing protein, partial [Bacteroidota bacterium]